MQAIFMKNSILTNDIEKKVKKLTMNLGVVHKRRRQLGGGEGSKND